MVKIDPKRDSAGTIGRKLTAKVLTGIVVKCASRGGIGSAPFGNLISELTFGVREGIEAENLKLDVADSIRRVDQLEARMTELIARGQNAPVAHDGAASEEERFAHFLLTLSDEDYPRAVDRTLEILKRLRAHGSIDVIDETGAAEMSKRAAHLRGLFDRWLDGRPSIEGLRAIQFVVGALASELRCAAEWPNAVLFVDSNIVAEFLTPAQDAHLPFPSSPMSLFLLRSGEALVATPFHLNEIEHFIRSILSASSSARRADWLFAETSRRVEQVLERKDLLGAPRIDGDVMDDIGNQASFCLSWLSNEMPARFIHADAWSVAMLSVLSRRAEAGKMYRFVTHHAKLHELCAHVARGETIYTDTNREPRPFTCHAYGPAWRHHVNMQGPPSGDLGDATQRLARVLHDRLIPDVAPDLRLDPGDIATLRATVDPFHQAVADGLDKEAEEQRKELAVWREALDSGYTQFNAGITRLVELTVTAQRQFGNVSIAG